MNSSPSLDLQPSHGVPYIPQQSPFSTEQRAWLNGYLAGMFSRALDGKASPSIEVESSSPKRVLHILYGSQSGTAEGIAKDMAKAASNKGFDVIRLELNDYSKLDLSKPIQSVIITSTWGDGEPPDNALQFWREIQDPSAPRWDQVSYSVLALGDQNYSDFCGAGKRFDDRLAELGAKRLLSRVDCDVDYEEAAKAWLNQIWEILDSIPSNSAFDNASSKVAGNAKPSIHSEKNGKTVAYGRKHPFAAKFILQSALNHENSSKDTRHVEIDMSGSGLTYTAGDALGVFPVNCPDLVDTVIRRFGLDGDSVILSQDGIEKSIRESLLRDCQLTKINKKLWESMSQLEGITPLVGFDQLQEGMDVLDLIKEPCQIKAQDLVACLPKLQPRLYSIASSPKAFPDSIHLTVGIVRFELEKRARKGVCSSFFADRIQPGEHLPVFVHKSTFRLPEDKDRNVIMVGPGTGIAPFRGFLQDRATSGGQGKNWLFFGDQKAATDFLYQDELKAFQTQGVLSQLDTAFSRDQARKIYVQDRMLERAKELWKWIDGGAHFYVCGDAKRMARDVDRMLHQILSEAGGLDEESTKSYVAGMKKEKRYMRDVY